MICEPVRDSVSRFEDETAVEAVGAGRWRTRLSANWNIGDNSNGGYALTPVLRAMGSLVAHRDPISITTHFLRPGRGGTDAEVRACVIRSGRTVSTLRGSLWQEGTQRLEVMAAFSDLASGGSDLASGGSDLAPGGSDLAPGGSDLAPGGSDLAPGGSDLASGGMAAGHHSGAPAGAGSSIAEAAPRIPPPEECVHRVNLGQGVDLSIQSRVDICVHPDHAAPGGSNRARLDGWVRFSDGAAPSTLALAFFADALPPSLYPLLGSVGWVPTIEMTVHPRHPPADGWLQVRQESHDLRGGRMVESGSLWDSTGVLVACSRQVGLLLV